MIKKKPVSIAAAFVFLAGLTFLFGGCAHVTSGSKAAEMIQAKGELRVGICPNYPPLIFKDGQEIKGLEADMAAAVGEHFSVPVVYVEKPFDQLIPGLNAGEFDVIMSGISVTDKRKELVQFAAPYMTVGQIALIRKQDKARFDPPEKALYENGMRIGYEKGTTGMTFTVNTLLLAELVDFDSAEEGLAALRGGEIAIFVHDSPTAWRIAADPASDLMILSKPLTEEPLAWAVKTDDQALLHELNKIEAGLKTSGKMQELMDKWIPVVPAKQ